jgi:hypothetical protein
MKEMIQVEEHLRKYLYLIINILLAVHHVNGKSPIKNHLSILSSIIISVVIIAKKEE